MKVILTRDVKDLGKTGQVVNVAEGHARNFLLPRKLAILADEGAMKALDAKKKLIETKGEKLQADAQAMAEKIANLNVVITGKAGAGTRLYGSVTNQEIAAALLSQHQVKVDKRLIHISEPIKNTGEFVVPVKLYHDISADIHVQVVGQAE